jgi:hypothetical protein
MTKATGLSQNQRKFQGFLIYFSPSVANEFINFNHALLFLFSDADCHRIGFLLRRAYH